LADGAGPVGRESAAGFAWALSAVGSGLLVPLLSLVPATFVLAAFELVSFEPTAFALVSLALVSLVFVREFLVVLAAAGFAGR
jgi:hypothetical protein